MAQAASAIAGVCISLLALTAAAGLSEPWWRFVWRFDCGHYAGVGGLLQLLRPVLWHSVGRAQQQGPALFLLSAVVLCMDACLDLPVNCSWASLVALCRSHLLISVLGVVSGRLRLRRPRYRPCWHAVCWPGTMASFTMLLHVVAAAPPAATSIARSMAEWPADNAMRIAREVYEHPLFTIADMPMMIQRVFSMYAQCLGFSAEGLLYGILSLIGPLTGGAVVQPHALKMMMAEPIYLWVCGVCPSGSCKSRAFALFRKCFHLCNQLMMDPVRVELVTGLNKLYEEAVAQPPGANPRRGLRRLAIVTSKSTGIIADFTPEGILAQCKATPSRTIIMMEELKGFKHLRERTGGSDPESLLLTLYDDSSINVVRANSSTSLDQLGTSFCAMAQPSVAAVEMLADRNQSGLVARFMYISVPPMNEHLTWDRVGLNPDDTQLLNMDHPAMAERAETIKARVAELERMNIGDLEAWLQASILVEALDMIQVWALEEHNECRHPAVKFSSEASDLCGQMWNEIAHEQGLRRQVDEEAGFAYLGKMRPQIIRLAGALALVDNALKLASGHVPVEETDAFNIAVVQPEHFKAALLLGEAGMRLKVAINDAFKEALKPKGAPASAAGTGAGAVASAAADTVGLDGFNDWQREMFQTYGQRAEPPAGSAEALVLKFCRLMVKQNRAVYTSEELTRSSFSKPAGVVRALAVGNSARGDNPLTKPLPQFLRQHLARNPVFEYVQAVADGKWWIRRRAPPPPTDLEQQESLENELFQLGETSLEAHTQLAQQALCVPPSAAPSASMRGRAASASTQLKRALKAPASEVIEVLDEEEADMHDTAGTRAVTASVTDMASRPGSPSLPRDVRTTGIAAQHVHGASRTSLAQYGVIGATAPPPDNMHGGWQQAHHLAGHPGGILSGADQQYSNQYSDQYSNGQGLQAPSRPPSAHMQQGRMPAASSGAVPGAQDCAYIAQPGVGAPGVVGRPGLREASTFSHGAVQAAAVQPGGHLVPGYPAHSNSALRGNGRQPAMQQLAAPAGGALRAVPTAPVVPGPAPGSAAAAPAGIVRQGHLHSCNSTPQLGPAWRAGGGAHELQPCALTPILEGQESVPATGEHQSRVYMSAMRGYGQQPDAQSAGASGWRDPLTFPAPLLGPAQPTPMTGRMSWLDQAALGAPLGQAQTTPLAGPRLTTAAGATPWLKQAVTAPPQYGRNPAAAGSAAEVGCEQAGVPSTAGRHMGATDDGMHSACDDAHFEEATLAMTAHVAPTPHRAPRPADETPLRRSARKHTPSQRASDPAFAPLSKRGRGRCL